MRPVAWAGAIVLLSLQTATAIAWDAQVTGPDVFGATKVFASTGGIRENLIVQCDSDKLLFIALLFPKKEFEAVNETPATLFVQIDSDSPQKLTATLRSWNDNFAGIVVTDREVVARLVFGIEGSKQIVKVGYDIFGVRDSMEFSSRGSKNGLPAVSSG